MNIHITLVGGQTLPVYLGIRHAKPDKVIFICSQDTEKDASLLQNEMLCQSEVILLDPVDYTSIVNCALKLRQQYSSEQDEVTVNITGGTKLWVIAFYGIFVRFSTVLYVDQNGYLLDLCTGKKQLMDVRLDYDLVFKLNNNVAKSYRLITEYTDEDKRALDKIKKLRLCNYKVFNSLSVFLKREWAEDLIKEDEGGWELPNRSSVAWNKQTNEIAIDIFDSRGCFVQEHLSSSHVFSLFFHSGWFEYEVAEMLSKWKYAKEVLLNVVFPYKNGDSKNEIDVIVNTGFKLLFVECKTQIFDQTDIDKFNNAVKNYGGMGCKALFITESEMRVQAKEKCADSHILTFSIREQIRLGKFTEEICDALYAELESDLFNINPK